ncbi:hypothetical protein GGR58DRAFT_130483 [Xylaria digitata]|nr:hypothetical protein GGR58DRAFT_130483 [Xylaria digitata]
MEFFVSTSSPFVRWLHLPSPGLMSYSVGPYVAIVRWDGFPNLSTLRLLELALPILLCSPRRQAKPSQASNVRETEKERGDGNEGWSFVFANASSARTRVGGHIDEMGWDGLDRCRGHQSIHHLICVPGHVPPKRGILVPVFVAVPGGLHFLVHGASVTELHAWIDLRLQGPRSWGN